MKAKKGGRLAASSQLLRYLIIELIIHLENNSREPCFCGEKAGLAGMGTQTPENKGRKTRLL
jgi:hypothetical protein